jgi:protein-S-isoprenylcysteine O-methyltransferase Ste14
MTAALAAQIIKWMWIIWGAYWFISSWTVKTAVKRESGAGRLLHLGLMTIGISFFIVRLDLGPLNNPVLPNAPWTNIASVALVAAGLGLSFWARYHLGQYWSSSVSLKEDHRIIETGPYAYLRHPIYSGIILAIMGSFVSTGTYRTLLGFAVIVAALCIKAAREEHLLSGELGSAYTEYRRHTGFLVPRLR